MTGNIFRHIKRHKSSRGGIHLVYGGNRFVQYMFRDHVGHYRCSKFRMKCHVKLRVDEKMKFAQEKGTHCHDQTIVSTSLKYGTNENSTLNPKIDSTPCLEDFSKDVTTDVELITNERNATLLFLKGFKFTKYFENRTHNRFERTT